MNMLTSTPNTLTQGNCSRIPYLVKQIFSKPFVPIHQISDAYTAHIHMQKTVWIFFLWNNKGERETYLIKEIVYNDVEKIVKT